MTPKCIHNFIRPPKILISLKTPKNIEIQNLEPQNNIWSSLRMYENFRVPPPPHPRVQRTGREPHDQV